MTDLNSITTGRAGSERGREWLRRLALVAFALAALASCSPYASVDIGVPFKLGPVYVNPSIGVGGFL